MFGRSSFNGKADIVKLRCMLVLAMMIMSGVGCDDGDDGDGDDDGLDPDHDVSRATEVKTSKSTTKRKLC